MEVGELKGCLKGWTSSNLKEGWILDLNGTFVVFLLATAVGELRG